MAGSIKDSDIECARVDAWIPPQGNTFTWKQPWENIQIRVCLPNGDKLAQNDCTRYLSPLKMQFLKSRFSEGLQRIIQEIPTIEIKSLIFKEQLFEITLKSKSFSNECMEIVTVLMKPCDDVIIRPIPRLKFTSKLVESVFKNHVVQQKIDIFRDEMSIFVVGFQSMKDCIDDGIVQINRSTTTKHLLLKEKWQTVALSKLGIISDLIREKGDVSIVLNDQTDKVCIQGNNEDVGEAANKLQQMLGHVFVDYIPFDPLILKLLSCKEASEYFEANLKRRKIEVKWVVDDGKLCVFGKSNVTSKAISSTLYTNFISVGFDDTQGRGKSFCRSDTFTKLTTENINKLMVCESTTDCVYLATTKNIALNLLTKEKVHNAERADKSKAPPDEQHTDLDSYLDQTYEIAYDEKRPTKNSGEPSTKDDETKLNQYGHQKGKPAENLKRTQKGNTGRHYGSGGASYHTGDNTSKTEDPGKTLKVDTIKGEICCICIDNVTNPKRLPCGHIFCKDCIDLAFTHKKVCPSCGRVYGKLTGNQPKGGRMTMYVDKYKDLAGYIGYGHIQINYNIPGGYQTEEHPNPNKFYEGITRLAYLPNNEKGKLVANLLEKAFNQRLIFTIGRSRTSGHEGIVTWNDIHHKTRMEGGPNRSGYPDPTYLDRVLEELAEKGITKDSLQDK